MVPISRRAFLAATGGLVVVAACGSSGDDGGGTGDAVGFVGLRLSADQYAHPEPQRFAFAVQKDDRYFDGPPARVAFATPTVFNEYLDQELGAIPDENLSAYVETTLRAEGLPDGRGVYDLRTVFEEDGFWLARIEMEGETFELPFQVEPLPEGLIAGEPAPRAASPTPTDPLGVDPICTRDPGCGLHTLSLDQLVGAGRPVAVMFATPARCESQYCEPVLDLLLDLQDEFAEHVQLVHVEIFRNNTTQDLVPTLEPWGIVTEPWLFGVDGAGNVTERLGGAFDRSQVRELLQRLTG